jgi:hypothetical protein
MREEMEETGEISLGEEEIAAGENFSFKDVGELIKDMEVPEGGESVAPAAEAEETIELIEEPLELLEEPVATSFDRPTEKTVTDTSDIAEGDRFVAEGKFYEAMSAYRKSLASAPGNKKVLQRVEELRALLKLMGKDKEVLIAQLDAFLEGINKRRDEFFRRS